jgi:hypothetical protein
MLDQSFTPEKFFKIFYHENRKGTFKRELLSNEYLECHDLHYKPAPEIFILAAIP